MKSVSQRVLECIEQLPDATTNDIVELLDDVPSGSVSSALCTLYAGRKVTRQQTHSPTGRLTFTYRVADPKTAPIPAIRKYKARTKASTVKHKVITPTPAGMTVRTDFVAQSKASMRGRIRQLEDEVASLRTWKEEALLRYPDLAVDPLMLKARKIVADLLTKRGEPVSAKCVTAGEKDSTLLVQATFEALQAA